MGVCRACNRKENNKEESIMWRVEGQLGIFYKLAYLLKSGFICHFKRICTDIWAQIKTLAQIQVSLSPLTCPPLLHQEPSSSTPSGDFGRISELLNCR